MQFSWCLASLNGIDRRRMEADTGQIRLEPVPKYVKAELMVVRLSTAVIRFSRRRSNLERISGPQFGQSPNLGQQFRKRSRVVGRYWWFVGEEFGDGLARVTLGSRIEKAHRHFLAKLQNCSSMRVEPT